MAHYYRTEYRLGKRGRIRRSYTGLAAFAAIFCDLLFGLVFDLLFGLTALSFRLLLLTIMMVAAFLRRTWDVIIAITAAFLALLTLPFVVLHHAVNRLRSRIEKKRDDIYAAAVKTDWALGREL